ncbi:MAG: aminoacyl-tRNA hydrolase [Legionellales bacterium]|nr:aminoacyl-tRNA hydrolase [Legionellales bacterium]
MSAPTRLIVGLGNPGPQYEATRHNVGWWFLNNLAHQYHTTFHAEKKFFGLLAKTIIAEQECLLLMPNTFMNLSGQAVLAVAHYYKIPPEAILVVHDELDLDPGIIRFKPNGGHGGHNGLRHIIDLLHSTHFYRLRIGIGKPTQKNSGIDYVLSRPSKAEEEKIYDAMSLAQPLIPLLVQGKHEHAMQQLHSKI